MRTKAVVSLRNYNFYKRLPFISSSADGRSIHSALVWRFVIGLDDLYAIFPGDTGARLFLLSLH